MDGDQSMAVSAAHHRHEKGRSSLLIVALAALTTLAAGGACIAADDDTAAQAMPLGEATAAPTGFLDFCARQPSECGLQQGASSEEERRSTLYRRYYWSLALPGRAPEAAPDPRRSRAWNSAFVLAGYSSAAPRADWRTSTGEPALTPELMGLLKRVDTSVNRSIRYVRAGADDRWSLPIEQAAGFQPKGNCKDYVLEKRKALIQQGLSPQSLSIALVDTWKGESHAVLLVATDKGEYVLDNNSDSVKRWDKVDYRWVSRQAPGETFRWVSVGESG